jgi:hypothetical protein
MSSILRASGVKIKFSWYGLIREGYRALFGCNWRGDNAVGCATLKQWARDGNIRRV